LVDGKSEFKLGEIIVVVAFYYPDHEIMYYVRKATPEEVEKENLSPVKAMKKVEVNFELMRQELLSFFSSYCSEIFSEYLLLCLLSEEPLFLGADSDVSALI
jgi:hypothetical protein